MHTPYWISPQPLHVENNESFNSWQKGKLCEIG